MPSREGRVEDVEEEESVFVCERGRGGGGAFHQRANVPTHHYVCIYMHTHIHIHIYTVQHTSLGAQVYIYIRIIYGVFTPTLDVIYIYIYMV